MTQLSIVLVGAKGDANIGATARAMKNFGIADLRLVNTVPHRTKAAYQWAVDARDILDDAKIFTSLDEALFEKSCALAFTRRLGKSRKQHLGISELGDWIKKKKKSGGIALVFGREDKGLTNDEISRCDAIVTIPTSAELPSMNLAQAVLIACYELFRSFLDTFISQKQEFVSRHEIKGAIARLGYMLDALGYADNRAIHLRSKILHQFERLFGRGGLTARDVKMLEGLAARVIEKAGPKK